MALDENLDKVHQHCKDIANIINAVSNVGRRHLTGRIINFDLKSNENELKRAALVQQLHYPIRRFEHLRFPFPKIR